VAARSHCAGNARQPAARRCAPRRRRAAVILPYGHSGSPRTGRLPTAVQTANASWKAVPTHGCVTCRVHSPVSIPAPTGLQAFSGKSAEVIPVALQFLQLQVHIVAQATALLESEL